MKMNIDYCCALCLRTCFYC